MPKKGVLKIKEKEKIINLLKNENKSVPEIARLTGRDVRTIKTFLESPFKNRKPRKDKGVPRKIQKNEKLSIKRVATTNPGLTSGEIFLKCGLEKVPKTSRNRHLKTIAAVKSPQKILPLKAMHKKKRLVSAKTYKDQPVTNFLFSDESRISLDGPDCWSKGWVVFKAKSHKRIKRQQKGGGIMIWGGIYDDQLIGPVRIPEGSTITALSYIEMLKSTLIPWLEKQDAKKRGEIIFVQDNAPAHSAKITKEFLLKQKINVMNWPPFSPDLNPIENLWSIIKRRIYVGGKQFVDKNTLWEKIKEVASKIEPEVIKKIDIVV